MSEQIQARKRQALREDGVLFADVLYGGGVFDSKRGAPQSSVEFAGHTIVAVVRQQPAP